MLTENTLNDVTLEDLLELMVFKIQEIRANRDEKGDRELYNIKKEEIKLLQKLINQKKAVH